MGRKSLKEVRQQEIVKVFYEVARKEGLENTSIARIAKEMDINPSLIIHYFQTRDDLTYELINYILDKYQHIYRVRLKKPVDSKMILFGIIDNIFSRKWHTLFDDSLFYSCYSLAFRDSKIRDMYRKLLDSLRDTLKKHIEQCILDGHIESIDPEYVTDNIFILVDGAYFYLSLVSDKNEYASRLQRYKQQAIDLLQLKKDSSLVVGTP